MLGRALDLLRDLVAPPVPPFRDRSLPVVHVERPAALPAATGLVPYDVLLGGAAPLIVRVWARDEADAAGVGRELLADRRLRHPAERASDAALVARRAA